MTVLFSAVTFLFVYSALSKRSEQLDRRSAPPFRAQFISNRQLAIIYATYRGAQILIYTLGTGGKGEVFMAVENVSPSFSLQPCNKLARKQLFLF